MRGWRFAAALAVAVVAAWAGARLYIARHPADGLVRRPMERGIAVPAGGAGGPGIHALESDCDLRGSDLPGSGLPGSGLPGSGLPPAKIPERLPAFTLADSHGRPTSINSWPGKSLIINFWATWCEPCRREIPLLKSVAAEWSGRDFEVIGIAVDHPDKVASFAAEFAIHYPLLVGEQDALDAAAALGMETPAFPFTVFTDRQRHVVALYLGELHPPQADLILSVVQRLNRGTLDLPAAREAIDAGLAGMQPHRSG